MFYPLPLLDKTENGAKIKESGKTVRRKRFNERRNSMSAEKKSRYDTARKILIFWTLFIGIGAVAGATGMLVDPTGKAMGMDAMLPYFKVLPFSDILFTDLTFSGYALLIVNGLTNLTAAALMFAKKKAGTILGGIFGVTLMLWICIQFYMFPLNFMSTIYFIFGLCQAATGYAAYVFGKQEDFTVDENRYKNIGTNHKRLVVFFSRMGYVQKLAFGFWWCGRFGMHRWEMPIAPVDIDLTKYEHITICSPIWVFALAATVRSFCAQSKGKIKEADYILVHHTKGVYENAAAEMDGLLGLKHTELRSISCKKGKYKTIK